MYTNSALRDGLGLDIRTIHMRDYKAGEWLEVHLQPSAVAVAEQDAVSLVSRLCTCDFLPNPGRTCMSRDVRRIFRPTRNLPFR